MDTTSPDTPLDNFLKDKRWSNADFARELRPRQQDESEETHKAVILNLTKNIAKWRKDISRPGGQWLPFIESVSGGVLTSKSFYRSPHFPAPQGVSLPRSSA